MYLINQVANKVNLSQKRIRDYEREGFIRPEREPRTNNRLYSDFEISQIMRINHLIHDQGFTLSCLRRLLALAPCWNIFACKTREECAAFQQPHRNCWKIRAEVETRCPGPCGRCALYLNRSHSGEALLNRAGNPLKSGDDPK